MSRLREFIDRHVIDRDELSAIRRFSIWLPLAILKAALWLVALSAILLGAFYIFSQTLWQPKRLVCNGSIVSLPISPAGAEQATAQLSLYAQPNIWPWQDGYNFMTANLYMRAIDEGGLYYPKGFILNQVMVDKYAIYFDEDYAPNSHLTYFREINSVSLDYTTPSADGPRNSRFFGKCSENEAAL
jgi:hypothetical protein